MTESSQKNEAPRSSSVMQIGRTGCSKCDAARLPACRCKTGGAGGGDGSDTQENSFAKEPSSMSQAGNLKPNIVCEKRALELRYVFESPEPSLADRRALKSIYDEACAFNEHLTPNERLCANFDNHVLVVEAPSIKMQDDFLMHLGNKGMHIAKSSEATESQVNKPFHPTPFKKQYKPER